MNREPKNFLQLKQDFLELLSRHVEEPAEKRLKLDILENPGLLIGKKVRHKFENNGKEDWYEGYVVSYDSRLKTHEIVYIGGSEHYLYNLVEDIEDGSLVVK